jgi:hypothetical protein
VRILYRGGGTTVAVEGGWALVLTARHVAPKPDAKVCVRWGSGPRRPATWLGADDAVDLAALAVLAAGRHACPPAEGPPAGGAPVGYPGLAGGARAEWFPKLARRLARLSVLGASDGG